MAAKKKTKGVAKRSGKTLRSSKKKSSKKRSSKKRPGKSRQNKQKKTVATPPVVQYQVPVDRLIEEKQKEIAELQARKMSYTEIPCDVSVVIPVFNAFAWLGQAIMALAYGNQSIPLKVWLCDNGSTDPLKSALTREPGFSEMTEWLKSLGFVGGGILDPVLQKSTHRDGTPMEPQERINKNLEHLWKKMTMAVDTRYIWYIDGDVIAPKDSGRVLREYLDTHPDCAFVGIIYDHKTDHVKMGCSMGRTSIMQKLDWQSIGCPCRWVNYQLRKWGHTVAHIDPHVRPADTHARMVATHGRALGGRIVDEVIEGKAG